MTGNCPALNDRRWSIRREAIKVNYCKGFEFNLFTLVLHVHALIRINHYVRNEC